MKMKLLAIVVLIALLFASCSRQENSSSFIDDSQAGTDESNSSSDVSHSESDSVSSPVSDASSSSEATFTAQSGSLATDSSETAAAQEAPGPFQQTFPCDEGIATSSTPTLEWSTSENAESYVVTIASDSYFKNIVGEYETGNNSYTLNTELQNNSVYYWRVKAVNPVNTTDSVNATMSFMTIYDIGNYIDSYLNQNPVTVEEGTVAAGDYYSPQNTTTWDYWFVKTGDTYHAFHLERPLTERSDYIDIGHAVSSDLSSWKYYGSVVKAQENGWDDLRIATGSTVYKDGLYYLYYTGHSSTQSGIGLSVSKDLYRWVKMGSEALMPASKVYTVDWNGQQVDAKILADPYVYPDAVDGWYYMVANAAVVNSGENCGAILMLRSQDLLNWEGYKIVTFPESFARMETPQIWTENGNWYLYFGGVKLRKNVDSIDSTKQFLNGSTEVISNYIYMSDSISGVYEEKDWSNLTLPDSKPFYICKILKDPQNRDVLLTTFWGVWKLSQPYEISYNSDGSISFQ